jgi:hypothetical protein
MLAYAGEYLASRTGGRPPCRRALVIGSAALVSELQERGIHCVAPEAAAGGYLLYLLYWYKSTKVQILTRRVLAAGALLLQVRFDLSVVRRRSAERLHT